MRPVRSLVFVLAAVAAVAVYGYVRTRVASRELQDIRLAEVYGALSLVLMYIALAISPLYSIFPARPGRALLYRARRAIGISAFCFAFVHTWVAFFKLLAGWQGLAFLSERYLDDLVRSSVALGVLFALAATSTDWAVERLGRCWKLLHRLLYIGGLLVLLHVVTLGSHFLSPISPASLVTFILVAILIVSEGVRLDRWLAVRYPIGNLGGALALSLFGVTAAAFFFFGESNGLNIHSQHAAQGVNSAAPR